MATKKIKVLTVRQPWAELLVIGAKQYETRPMRINYRGELYIHAAKLSFSDLELCYQNEHFKRCIPHPSRLAASAIIGKVEIVDCLSVDFIKALPKAQTRQELVFGDYREGRYGWRCINPVKFDKPISHVRGMQGIWEYELLTEAQTIGQEMMNARLKEVHHG